MIGAFEAQANVKYARENNRTVASSLTQRIDRAIDYESREGRSELEWKCPLNPTESGPVIWFICRHYRTLGFEVDTVIINDTIFFMINWEEK